jgi:membrane protein
MRAFGELLVESGRNWAKDRAARLAAALAYYTLFSLAPLLIVVVGIAGQWLGRSMTVEEITNYLVGIVGLDAAQWVGNLAGNFTAPETFTLTAVASVAVIVWGASNAFNHLKETLNIIWGVKPGPVKAKKKLLAVLRSRLLAFGAVFLAVFLMVAYLLANTLLSAVLGLMGEIAPWTLALLPKVQLIQIAQFAVGLVVFTGLLAILYKFLPDVEMVWRDVLVGAAFTSVLISVGNLALSVYFSASSVGSLYGAAGSIMVLLVWLYYSAQMFLFGAEFTEVYARRFGSRFRPAGHAVWVRPKTTTGGAAETGREAQPVPADGDKPARGASRS